MAGREIVFGVKLKGESSGLVASARAGEQAIDRVGDTARSTGTEIAGLGGQVRTTTRDLVSLDAGGQQAARGMESAEAASGRLATSLSRVAAAVSAALSVGELVSVTREFDRINAGLKTVTGSSEAAAEAFRKIQDFAATTPYDLAQVSDSFVKLSNYGLAASERALKSYGDTASSMGKSLDQMVEAVADAATGEFERLKEFGIRANSEGDKVIFTFRGISAEVKKSASEIEEHLIRLGEANFAGAMQERMATLDGALSNFGDTWTSTLLAVSQSGIGDAIEGSVRSATGALQLVADHADIAASAVTVLGAAVTGRMVSAMVAATAASAQQFIASRQATAANLAAAEAAVARAAAEARMAAVMGGAAAANQALAAAEAQLTAARAASAAQANIARGVLTAMGGPIGLITTALTLGVTAWALWGDAAERNANRAAGALRRVQEEAAKTGRLELEVAKEARDAAKAALQKELDTPAAQGFGRQRNARVETARKELAAAEAALAQIETRERNIAERMKSTLGETSSALGSEWAKLHQTQAERRQAAIAELDAAYAAETAKYAGNQEKQLQLARDYQTKRAQIEKQFSESAKKERDAFADLATELSGLSRDFYAQWETLSKGFDEGRFGEGEEAVQRLAEAQAKLLAQQPAIRANMQAEAKAAEELARVRARQVEEVERKAETAEREAAQEEARVRRIGLTTAQLYELEQAEIDAAIAAAERAAASVTADEAGKKELQAIERQIAALQRLKKANAEGYARQAAVEATQEAAAASTAMWNDLERTAHDTFVSIVNGNKDAWTRLRETAKNTFFDWLYQMTIKKWIINIAANVSSQGAASQAVGGSGNGGLINSLVGGQGTGVGDLVSLFGTSSGSGAVAGSLQISNAIGMAGGDSLGAFMDLNAANWGTEAGSSFLGTVGTGLGYLGTGLTAYGVAQEHGAVAGLAAGAGSVAVGGAVGGTLGIGAAGAAAAAAGGGVAGAAAGAMTALAAVPVWGWIALAAAAILGANSKGGTPHAGAAVFAGPDGTVSPTTLAETRGLYADPADADGFGESDFYKRRQEGVADALTPVAEQAAGILNNTLKSFGLQGGASVGLAFSSDGEDKSRGRFSVIDAAGREIAEFAKKYSKDATKGMKAFADDVAGGLRDALVAADLPEWADEILESLGKDPGMEQLGNALSQIDALRQAAEQYAPTLGLAEEAFVSLMQRVGGDLVGQYFEGFYTEAERYAVAGRQLESFTERFEALGVTAPKTIGQFRALTDAIDTTTDEGLELYGALLQLAPAFAASQEATLSLIGTTRDDLAGIIREGLAGNTTAQATADALSQAVTNGIWMAMADSTAGLVTDLMIGGIINPAIQALLMGGNIAEAIGAGQLDAVVSQIRGQVEAFNAVMADPAIRDALAAVTDSMSGIGQALAGADSSSYYRASKAAEEAATAAAKAWEDARDAAVSAAEANVSRLQGLSDLLRSTLDGMRIDTVQDDANRRRQAQAQLNASLAIARASGGKALPEAETIRGSLEEVSKPSAGLFSSFEDYARDFWTTAGVINDLAELTELQLTSEQALLRYLKGQGELEAVWHADTLARYDAMLAAGAEGNALAAAQNDTLSAMAYSLRLISQEESHQQQLNNNVGGGYAYYDPGSEYAWMKMVEEKYGSDIVGDIYKLSSGYSLATAEHLPTDLSMYSQEQIDRIMQMREDLGLSNQAVVPTPDQQVGGAVFDEAAYLERYPDVAQAIQDGILESALQHYLGWGINEGRIPGFASGGQHEGGWRWVGERGPELEYTGPSTIYSNRQSTSLIDVGAIVAALDAMRGDMLAGHLSLAKHAQETAQYLKRWTLDGLPETRTL